MTKKLISIGLVGLVIALGLAGIFFFGRDKNTPPKAKSTDKTVVKSNAVGLSVERDVFLVQKSLTPEETQKGKLWEFTQPKTSAQQFLIDADYEQGTSLKKLTAYTKKSLRESVVDNINIQLPQQYPEFKQISQRNLTVNGVEANETIFEYVNAAIRVRQRLLLLFKNNDTAIYIRAQAKADEYAGISRHYFEPMLSSAKFE